MWSLRLGDLRVASRANGNPPAVGLTPGALALDIPWVGAQQYFSESMSVFLHVPGAVLACRDAAMSMTSALRGSQLFS